MNHLNRQERIGTGLAAGSVLLIGGSVAASSLLGGYPVLGGQGIRYLVAGLLLAAWARLRRNPLPRPAGREWAWLAGLAVIGLAGCSVLLIEATRVADPASVGVVIGAAPLVIVIAAAVAAGNRRSRGNRRNRGGSARRRHRIDLERNRAAAVGWGTRRCRGHIPAGRTGSAPARRPR